MSRPLWVERKNSLTHNLTTAHSSLVPVCVSYTWPCSRYTRTHTLSRDNGGNERSFRIPSVIVWVWTVNAHLTLALVCSPNSFCLHTRCLCDASLVILFNRCIRVQTISRNAYRCLKTRTFYKWNPSAIYIRRSEIPKRKIFNFIRRGKFRRSIPIFSNLFLPQKSWSS